MARLLQIAQLGHPVLLGRAREVRDIASVQDLIDDLLLTVADANGVGIAAPQVYEAQRVIIVASRPNARYPYAPLMDPTPMINPEIVTAAEECAKDWEGCLSAPGVRALVPRSKRVEVRYLTRDGAKETKHFEDFIARIVQHEVDHLDGISFLERVDNPKEIFMEREFLKAIAGR